MMGGMTNRIDVEDHTDEQAGSQQQEAFAERISGLCQIGEEMAITALIATAVPTTVLVMSITNFPALAQEVATAMHMSQVAGDKEAESALALSMQVMNVSYKSCSEELDIRMPARATLAEVGLEEDE